MPKYAGISGADSDGVSIEVQYEGFFAARELAEIIEIAEDEIWLGLEEELWNRFGPPFRPAYFARYRYDQPPPIFCITAIESGSALIHGLVGTAALMYCAKRFRGGLLRSRFPGELEHTGTIVGNIMADVLGKINSRLEEWMADATQRKTNVRGVSVKRTRKRGDESNKGDTR